MHFSGNGRWIVVESENAATVLDVAVDLNSELPGWVPQLAEAWQASGSIKTVLWSGPPEPDRTARRTALAQRRRLLVSTWPVVYYGRSGADP